MTRPVAVALYLCTCVLLTAACTKEAPAPPRFVLDDPALVARNNEGVGQMGRFEYDAAHETFKALAAEHPTWSDAKVNFAIATLNRQKPGDEEAALALLEEVLLFEPRDLRARYCAAILHMRAGRSDRALSLFRAVAEADPTDPYVAYFLAQSLEGTDDATALELYRRIIDIDPYLRSAYWRAFQLLNIAGRPDEAAPFLADFQRLEKNPRARLVELKYTRMGAKGMALAIDVEAPASPAPRPTGAIFADAAPLLADPAGRWDTGLPGRPFSITACDLDGDGRTDVFIANALREDEVVNAVVMNRGDGSFALDRGHPLAAVPSVNAALWGDVDNDGLVDVYLCRRGPNALWRQTTSGAWEDVTAAAGAGAGAHDTIDGALADLDHDGDLDVFCVNIDGPNELLNNDLDGTFRAIGAAQGVAGGGRPSRHVVVADLDGDRDTDIVVIKVAPPHEIYLNDRLWSYVPAMAPFSLAEVVRAAAADLDADGFDELYGVGADGAVVRYGGAAPALSSEPEPIRGPDQAGSDGGRQIAILDVTGDGEGDLVRTYSSGWAAEALAPDAGVGPFRGGASGALSWGPVMLDAGAGPSIVAMESGVQPLVWRPGPGRHAFASFTFAGRTEKGGATRSNASGIGARAVFRTGSAWSSARVPGSFGGPGQSLQPVAVGLGGAAKVDFVAVDWSDGVLQTELALPIGARHEITETQRQLSSCPVLFAWDGARYAFVSDVLGVGGIGYLLEPGAYAEPRPREDFLLPEGLLKPRDGRYEIKVGEPMEEACYLDSVRLVRWDLPPGWKMTIDERMAVNGPEPTGTVRVYRDEVLPKRATNDRDEDVTDAVTRADLVAAPVGALDERFIGRLARDHVVTLEFDDAIDRRAGAPILVIDGWVEYPYSQTMFAAWQAGAEYRAPTLEARDSGGAWHVVLEQFGYPAGMPRQMSVPLTGVPAGATALRLTTNQEIYWDRISVAWAQPCPDAKSEVVPLAGARVDVSGFARRTTGPQRAPHYDYDRRAPFWDTRHQTGFYTAFGPMTELVTDADDAVAIIGPGEEIHVEFEAPSDPVAPGWTRRFTLETRGWCKDMDLFTRDGETIEPLPSGRGESDRRVELHRRYNTRYASGR